MLGENLPGQSEDWMYKECGIKKQFIITKTFTS